MSTPLTDGIKTEEISSQQNLSDFAIYLINKWWIILVVTIIAGIAGFLYAKNQKPLYESRLTFALDEGGGGGKGVGSLMNFASQLGINFGGSSDVFSGDNILEIIKSRRMVEKALLSIDTFEGKPSTLIARYLRVNNWSEDKIKGFLFLPGTVAQRGSSYKQDSLLYLIYDEFIKKNIRAGRPDKKLGIYEVNVSTPEEKLTKVFTDRLVYYTNDYYTELKTKKARETLDLLERRVGAMKGNLNSSITERAVTQDQNLNPAFSAAQVPALKQQANIQVYGGAYAEMFKNMEIARFQYLKEIPLMQIIDDANYPMKKIKKGKLVTAAIFASISFLLLLALLLFVRLFVPYFKIAFKKGTSI